MKNFPYAADNAQRYGSAEYLRFVSIARGSLAELDTELAVAERLGFVRTDELKEGRGQAESVGPMLTTLAKSLHA